MTHKHDIFNPRQVTSEPFTPSGIANEMLAAWETIIPEHAGIALSPTRQIQLNLLFTNVFNSRLIRWADFVDLIESSEFLMSKVAGGNIDWAIELENCQMILAGDYPGGSNDSSANQSSDTDAASTAPATPAAPTTPAALTEPTAQIVNGEKEYSHGGMLSTRKPQAGS